MSVRVSTSENERFLDQFRYSIIASHLLVQEAKPSSATNLSHQLRDEQTWRHCTNYPFSVHGAAFITTISFLTAWLFHWVTVRSAILPWNIGIIVGLMVIAAIGIYAYARKKALQRSRQRAVNGLTDLITRSHALDSAARSALNLIQEIEIVSRGYEM